VRVLFDTCVPRPLRKSLPAHDIKTAQEIGWDRLRNGDLIQMAEEAFDVLITSDQKLKYQQNLTRRRISILILPTNNLRAVLGLAAKVAVALSEVAPGAVLEIQPEHVQFRQKSGGLLAESH
jgi:predicted nuclease of predicted toxin-antitoxin system